MQDKLKSVLGFLDEVIFKFKLERFEGEAPVKMVADQLKTHPKQVLRGAVGLIGLFAIALVLMLAQDSVYPLVSVIYPAFATAKALNNDDRFSRDAKLWLSYWTCYGILTVITGLFGFILRHIPFFTVIHIGLTIWLYHPKTRGAEVVNNSFLSGLIRKYAGVIDKHLEQATSTIGQATKTD